MKKILKIYENGNIDILDLNIIKNEEDLRFNDEYININKIIEYPIDIFRNYYIEKTSSDGYIAFHYEGRYKPGDLVPPVEGDSTSDYINVEGWESVTIRIRFLNMNGYYKPYVGISTFNQDKVFVKGIYEGYTSEQKTGNFTYVLRVPVDVSYIRITTNYNKTQGVEVKKTVEKGNSNNIKFFKAYEDMPEWVKKTNSHFSIFDDGIVIKGDILKNGEIIL